MFCTPRLCGLFLPDWGGGHEWTFNAFTYDEGGVLAGTRHIMVIKKLVYLLTVVLFSNTYY